MGRGERDRLRGALGLCRGQGHLAAAAGRAPRQAGRDRAGAKSRQGSLPSSSADPRRQLGARPAAAPAAPTRRAARSRSRRSSSPARRSSSASRRSAETVPRSASRISSAVCCLQLEAKAGRVAGGANRPGRVVDERAVVQDAQLPRRQVGLAAVGIDQARLAPQRDRHRVDREVAAPQVGREVGPRLDHRQRARVAGSSPSGRRRCRPRARRASPWRCRSARARSPRRPAARPAPPRRPRRRGRCRRARARAAGRAPRRRPGRPGRRRPRAQRASSGCMCSSASAMLSLWSWEACIGALPTMIACAGDEQGPSSPSWRPRWRLGMVLGSSLSGDSLRLALKRSETGGKATSAAAKALDGPRPQRDTPARLEAPHRAGADPRVPRARRRARRRALPGALRDPAGLPPADGLAGRSTATKR